MLGICALTVKHRISMKKRLGQRGVLFMNRLLTDVEPTELRYRMRQQRVAMELTQVELAQALKVRPNQISRWELGNDHPRKPMSRRIEAWLAKNTGGCKGG